MDRAFDKWVLWADKHPEAVAFGCRVLNSDGSFQNSARPFPSIWRYWIAALCLRPLSFISSIFYSDTYTGWDGKTEREIDWQYGCCVMFRSSVLREMKGFDPRFFYSFEEVSISCFRIWKDRIQNHLHSPGNHNSLGWPIGEAFPDSFCTRIVQKWL